MPATLFVLCSFSVDSLRHIFFSEEISFIDCPLFKYLAQGDKRLIPRCDLNRIYPAVHHNTSIVKVLFLYPGERLHILKTHLIYPMVNIATLMLSYQEHLWHYAIFNDLFVHSFQAFKTDRFCKILKQLCTVMIRYDDFQQISVGDALPDHIRTFRESQRDNQHKS